MLDNNPVQTLHTLKCFSTIQATGFPLDGVFHFDAECKLWVELSKVITGKIDNVIGTQQEWCTMTCNFQTSNYGEVMKIWKRTMWAKIDYLGNRIIEWTWISSVHGSIYYCRWIYILSILWILQLIGMQKSVALLGKSTMLCILGTCQCWIWYMSRRQDVLSVIGNRNLMVRMDTIQCRNETDVAYFLRLSS